MIITYFLVKTKWDVFVFLTDYLQKSQRFLIEHFRQKEYDNNSMKSGCPVVFSMRQPFT